MQHACSQWWGGRLTGKLLGSIPPENKVVLIVCGRGILLVLGIWVVIYGTKRIGCCDVWWWDR